MSFHVKLFFKTQISNELVFTLIMKFFKLTYNPLISFHQFERIDQIYKVFYVNILITLIIKIKVI